MQTPMKQLGARRQVPVAQLARSAGPQLVGVRLRLCRRPRSAPVDEYTPASRSTTGAANPFLSTQGLGEQHPADVLTHLSSFERALSAEPAANGALVNGHAPAAAHGRQSHHSAHAASPQPSSEHHTPTSTLTTSASQHHQPAHSVESHYSSHTDVASTHHHQQHHSHHHEPHANGHANGYVNGHANGHANGYVNGHQNGHVNGHVVVTPHHNLLPLDHHTHQHQAESHHMPTGSLREGHEATHSGQHSAGTSQVHVQAPLQPQLAAATAASDSSSSGDRPSSSSGDLTPSSSSSSSGGSSPAGAAAAAAEAPSHVQGIPQPILVISFVSASLTMASCVFQTLLPIYMVTELKMNMRSMGMFEGLLEAFSYLVRMFSGVVSDMMTSRKTAITLGFAMGAMAKFGMSGSTTVTQLFASKAIDRLANGVQAAPRDALISDLAPAASRSACFGFAQSMRKWGSFIGAGLSFFLMRASGNNYQLIFTMAASLTVASTLAFVMLVPSHARPLTPEQQKDQTAQQLYKAQQAQHAADTAAAAAEGRAAPAPPAAPAPRAKGLNPAKLYRDAVSMGSDFYRMLGVICMYGLGHINESMLEARAIEVGFGKAESTLIVAVLALVISFAAWPLGKLDDKHGPLTTFALGMSALIAGNLVLMLSGTHPMAVFVSCLFLGVHCAVIQGPLLSIVVSLAPPHLKGTAFGMFYTVMAVMTVIANSVYGTVWHTMGATSAFGLSVGWMVISLLVLPHLLPESLKRKGGFLKQITSLNKTPESAPVAPTVAPGAAPA